MSHAQSLPRGRPTSARSAGPQDFVLAPSANLPQLRELAMSAEESVQLEEVLSLDDEVALSETSVPRTDVMVAELEPARASKLRRSVAERAAGAKRPCHVALLSPL